MRAVGLALYAAQLGEMPPDAKPLKGFSGAGVVELAEDHRGDTYRAVYTVRFATRIYVLHVFQKKSKHAIATPQKEIELIRARLRWAERLYTGRTRGGLKMETTQEESSGNVFAVTVQIYQILRDRKITQIDAARAWHDPGAGVGPDALPSSIGLCRQADGVPDHAWPGRGGDREAGRALRGRAHVRHRAAELIAALRSWLLSGGRRQSRCMSYCLIQERSRMVRALPHRKAPVAASLTPASDSLAERPVWWLTYPGRGRIGHSSGEHRFKKPNS